MLCMQQTLIWVYYTLLHGVTGVRGVPTKRPVVNDSMYTSGLSSAT